MITISQLFERFPFRIIKDVVLILLAIHGIAMLLVPGPICDWRGVMSERIKEAQENALAQFSLSAPDTQQPPQEAMCKLMLDPLADPLICDCGSSVAEAISRGCQYDELAVAWLPDRCRDEALLRQFVVAGDGPGGQWLHWQYPNRTGLLTDKEIAQFPSTKRFYSSGRWLVVQCIYQWRKQIRQRNSGVVIEPRYNNINYIMRCADVFMSENIGSALTEGAVSLHSDEETVFLRLD